MLSLINDHYAQVNLKRQQLQQEQDRLNAAKGKLSTTSRTGDGTGAVVSAIRRKVLSEGECRTHAVLKGVCRDGTVHVRPLCTAGDVLLAHHELLDPMIFVHGCVQLPHVLADNFTRHVEGCYRYTYRLNAPGEWQYLR